MTPFSFCSFSSFSFISLRCSLISVSISARIDGAFSLNACEVLSLAFSSPMSYQKPLSLPPFLARNLPGGSSARISDTMEDAISLFSRLKRAVRYTRFLFSTSRRKCSLLKVQLKESSNRNGNKNVSQLLQWSNEIQLLPLLP